MLHALVGVFIGFGGSFALGRLFSGLLFGVRATDPATWLICSTSLILAVMTAAYLPAERLANMHPMLALRHE